MRLPRPKLRRVLAVAAGTLAAWVVGLVIAGFAARGCTQRSVERRIARSFDATAGFADTDLSLLRGRFSGTDLRIAKDETIGTLRVKVAHLEAELAPLGWCLANGHLRSLRLSGMDLQASSPALLRSRSKHGKPFAVDALELTDVNLTVMVTALMPGLGQLEVHVEHARSGPTVLRTALSWVFSLEDMAAWVDLPGGVRVRLEYANGRLRAQGGVFGSTLVELPFTIPVLDPAHELDQLSALGIDLAKKMTLEQAQRWLRSQWDGVKRVVAPAPPQPQPR